MSTTLKIAFNILFLLLSTITYSQNLNYVEINYNLIQTTFNSQQSSSINKSFERSLNSFINLYSNEIQNNEAIQRTKSKLEIINAKYSAFDVFPDSISDGWHEVIATDNLKFCQNAKVYVKNNEILEFVVDNCFRLNYSPIGTIREAKCTMSLNNFQGDEVKLIEIYFINDLEEQALVDPPLDPGYITFWTSNKKFVGNEILINDQSYSGLTYSFPYGTNTDPDCAEKGTLTYAFKPGLYTIKALKNGKDMIGSAEVMPNKCLIYRVY